MGREDERQAFSAASEAVQTLGDSVAGALPLDQLFALRTELDALEEQARVLNLDITAVLIGAAAEAVRDEMERHSAAPFAALVGTA